MQKERHKPEMNLLRGTNIRGLEELRGPGKDIWLFGGGELSRGLLDAKLVDTVEVAVIPVRLGGGIPLLPPRAKRTKLKLTGHEIYKTGIVSLEYSVQ